MRGRNKALLLHHAQRLEIAKLGQFGPKKSQKPSNAPAPATGRDDEGVTAQEADAAMKQVGIWHTHPCSDGKNTKKVCFDRGFWCNSNVAALV